MTGFAPQLGAKHESSLLTPTACASWTGTAGAGGQERGNGSSAGDSSRKGLWNSPVHPGTRRRWLVFLKASLHEPCEETQLYKSGKAETTVETAAFSRWGCGMWEQRDRPVLRLGRKTGRHQRARCLC